MTDQTENLPEPQWGGEEPPVDWGEAHPLERKPQGLDGDGDRPLANHLITISFTPKGQPMVVVRGNGGAQVNGLLEELEAEGVYMQLAAAQQTLQQSAPPAEMIQRQLGATPVAQAPGYAAPQQAPQPPYGGPQGYPQAAPAPAPQGWGQQPPAQPGWGASAPAGSGAPAGWLRVSAPFQQKQAFDAVKEQLKASGQYQGNVKWDGGSKTWLVSPAVAQWFAQWNPMPA